MGSEMCIRDRRDLMAANLLAEAGQLAEATQRYDAAATAAGNAGDKVMADLAALRSVLAQGPAMEASARDTVLGKLSTPGAPFELMALELKAVALINAQRPDDAVALIRQIREKDGLSEPMRRRLSEMMITLGVDPEPVADLPGGVPATMPAG